MYHTNSLISHHHQPSQCAVCLGRQSNFGEFHHDAHVPIITKQGKHGLAAMLKKVSCFCAGNTNASKIPHSPPLPWSIMAQTLPARLRHRIMVSHEWPNANEKIITTP